MTSSTPPRVAVLTAGRDPHYALGLAPALADAGIDVEVVGNSEMQKFSRMQHPRIQFFNLRGNQQANAGGLEKILRVVVYYARLLRFAWRSEASIFHVLWPNKFVYFDRTALNLYYRMLGKRLTFTAHNVNTEARDHKDSVLNRLSLKIQYNLMDHVFVHTSEMRKELQSAYGVEPDKITVLTFPINNVTPRSNLSREGARSRLGLPAHQKTLLFFGNIAPYKGLEDLVRAIPALKSRLVSFRVLIAGNVKHGEEQYLRDVNAIVKEIGADDVVDQRITYIPEEEVELYFKASDLLVLPYRRIFQSGVLFLSYSFGLPVLAADVGCLRDDVVEGKTGFVCKENDPIDLAEKIHGYFDSDLFANLEDRRSWIIDYANKTYSWERLAAKSREVYEGLLPQLAQSVSNFSSGRQKP